MSSEWTNLDDAFEGLEGECQEVIRGMTVEIWKNVLLRTPQFYGRMAASWSYSLGSPVYVDRSDEVDDQGLDSSALATNKLGEFAGLSRGHPAAINIAEAASAYNDADYRLGMTVYISNGVDHGEGPYSGEVEYAGSRLRAVNQPGAPLRRSINSARTNYGEDVTMRQALRLKDTRIGR